MNSEKWTLLRIGIEGIYPEGVISRLKMEKIPLYNVKKTDKNVLELCIERKYKKKVFTILNNSCYNILYVKNYGLSRIPVLCKEKLGVLIGCALFAALCIFSGYPVLKIEVVGAGEYYREKVIGLLAESGVSVGKGYKEEVAPEVTAKILSLDGVSFCSVKKSGNVLTVEVQITPSAELCERGELLQSPAEGVIYSLTVLRGEAKVSVGDEVHAGEVIVSTENGIVMASVRILCRIEKTVDAESEEKAYAKVLLDVGVEAELTNHSVMPSAEGEGYSVSVEYIVTESLNM